ncbi:5-dehydro-2-deoxygluconokinase [Cytobacillus firmus]|uniref:5-dehydro-2-deoxygluconokinase n=2 Tax=Cytobacillus TaxID=2675230 RepID=A0A366JS98_CYTFI|nr:MULTISPECIES: sugar kinase [Cytobacillus]RBP91466.1 5-dehydro-2-deoxygluconokinase [Cytobacillus firmus]TDX41666.1 5-dehydro-2-deoxygluconokinase [Cytobacillus oceanisediminis]
MDVVTIGETMALFTPNEEGMLRHTHSFSMKFGGAESNVAIGLSRLGHRSRWISRLGEDEFGDAMLSFIRGEGVDVSYVTRDQSAPTGVFFKEFRRLNDTRVYYYRKDSAASKMKAEWLEDEAIKDAEYLHLTGITPGLSASCREMLEKAIWIAKGNGTRIVFDPNLRLKIWRDEEEARQFIKKYASESDIVLPGISEAEFLFGPCTPEEYTEKFHDLGIDTVIMKLGKEGALISSSSVPMTRVPGFTVERVVDPVGAGDAFAAGVLSGLLDGKQLEEAVLQGNAMGAMVTMVNGDAEGLPNRSDLASFMNGSLEDVTR